MFDWISAFLNYPIQLWIVVVVLVVVVAAGMAQSDGDHDDGNFA